MDQDYPSSLIPGGNNNPSDNLDQPLQIDSLNNPLLLSTSSISESELNPTETFLYKIFTWTLQILVWFFLFSSIALYILKTQPLFLKISLLCFIFFYLLYQIFEFFSPISKFLFFKRKTGQGIYVKMGEFFMTPPQIEFSCECYHMKKIKKTMRTKQGSYEKTQKVKKITHTENFRFNYFSSRDVSGSFLLQNNRNKYFLILEILQEINFSDAVTYMDYIYQKEQFWRRNRFRDYYMTFIEKRYVPKMNKYNLLRLTNKDPQGVSFFFYALFTLLPFCQLYKLYFESFCVRQKFKLRKIISTRNNLSTDEEQLLNENFNKLNPKLNLISQQLTYEPTYYNYLNNNFETKEITEKEKNDAKVYQRQIPDYKTNENNGEVIDEEGFYCEEYNEPPPAFSTLPGDVALRKIMVNKKGGVPEAFEGKEKAVKMKEIKTKEEKVKDSKGQNNNNENEEDDDPMPENIMEK